MSTQKTSWFYTVTWWEGSLFECCEFDHMLDALNRYNQVKASVWQTKAKDIKILRYGKFIMDVTPIPEEAA